MRKIVALTLCTLLCATCACTKPRIDEKYTTDLVKKELSLSGPLTVKKISSGASGSMLFLVTSGEQKYVVKFIHGKKQQEKEICASKIASNSGYGPKVYFADTSRGVLVIEYLPSKITLQDLEGDQIYISLAHLLQKIHSGPPFSSTYDIFAHLQNKFARATSRPSLPFLKELGSIFNTLHETLSPYLTSTPCHNDLFIGNFRCSDNACKAIDFGDVGQNDPLFDVATVLSTLHVNEDASHEKLLFTTYLGHEPTEAQIAKLTLMKQLVLLKWIFDRLDTLSDADLEQYANIESIPLTTLFKDLISGNLDTHQTSANLKGLKSLVNTLIENSKSEEFRNSISILNR